MDKSLLQQQVLERLAEDLLQAEQAARAAHETATHEESVAENKYDTLGLEAAYLATGQVRRAGVAVGEHVAGSLRGRRRHVLGHRDGGGDVDPDPELIGQRVNGIEINDLADLEDVVPRTGAAIAVLATPAEAAQAVADRLVHLGVTSILNFAASVLTVPERVTVRKVDLGQELQILAYHEQRKSDEPVLAGPPASGTGHPEPVLTPERFPS